MSRDRELAYLRDFKENKHVEENNNCNGSKCDPIERDECELGIVVVLLTSIFHPAPGSSRLRVAAQRPKSIKDKVEQNKYT